jgi:hypothetical protein
VGVAASVTRPIDITQSTPESTVSHALTNPTPACSSDCALSQDPFVQTVIGRKIKQLLCFPEFHLHESEDLRQEFLAQLTTAMKKHRDEIGHRNPFIVMVIERKASNMLEYRRQSLRAEENIASLNVMIDDGNGKRRERSQCISEDDQHRRLEVHKRSATDTLNLQQDMASVIANMPDEWREFLHLRSEHSLSETARIMNVPRSRLKALVPKIAEVFEAAGLRDYLP